MRTPLRKSVSITFLCCFNFVYVHDDITGKFLNIILVFIRPICAIE